MTPNDVLKFWFEELSAEARFKKDKAVDDKIRARFLSTFEAANRGELWTWRRTPAGSLAEIILLDQFSRNMFRGYAQAFTSDNLALALAQSAIEKGFDRELPLEQRSFLYMPFMHSESLVIHDQAVKLFSTPGLEFNLKFEMSHRLIIEKYGRYPHRNAVLGRANTSAEVEFLAKNPEGF